MRKFWNWVKNEAGRTLYFDGYIAQLHRGERVQTAASAAAADATVEEVKALRSDLNAIGAALAAYTQKTAKLMAKFDVEGIPARV